MYPKLRFILIASSGLVGLAVGVYIVKKYYFGDGVSSTECTPREKVHSLECTSVNKVDDELLNMFNEQHSKSSPQEELFYFGPQKSIVNYVEAEEEMKILLKFAIIKGMRYSLAENIVSKNGYYLHPIYINDSGKNPLSSYDKNAIGVSIKDCKYNSNTKKLSSFAIIDKILDIGGQDMKNRGSF